MAAITAALLATLPAVLATPLWHWLGISRSLATAVGLPVEIANAWSKVGYAGNLQEALMGNATAFGVAVGLAERDALA